MTEPVEPVAVDSANLYMIEDVVINGVLFIILALLILVGGSLVAVWRSAPAWMGNSITPLVDGILKLASDYAAKTSNTMDDELIKTIRDLITKELLVYTAQIEVSPSVLAVDKAIYGANHSGGDNDLGDPIPANPVPLGG